MKILFVWSHFPPAWTTLAGIPKHFVEKGDVSLYLLITERERDLTPEVSGLCMESPATLNHSVRLAMVLFLRLPGLPHLSVCV